MDNKETGRRRKKLTTNPQKESGENSVKEGVDRIDAPECISIYHGKFSESEKKSIQSPYSSSD